MPTHRLANGGLSSADLDRIRDTLAGGRRPKVMFTESAGQIVGQTGQVVALADPQVTDDWLVVRFGHDELPFSPADLTLPSRGRGNGPAPAPKPRKEEDMPPAPSGNAAEPSTKASEPAKPERASEPAKSSRASEPAKSPRASKSARSKAPAGLTVTLAYQEGEWTVAAQQGSKVLAKPYLVRPAEALKLVGMVDVPGVQEAVEQVVAAERAEAEQRAEQLRAQLAQVEAQLAELKDAR